MALAVSDENGAGPRSLGGAISLSECEREGLQSELTTMQPLSRYRKSSGRETIVVSANNEILPRRGSAAWNPNRGNSPETSRRHIKNAARVERRDGKYFATTKRRYRTKPEDEILNGAR